MSDYEVEDRVNDSISFSYFCGLTIDSVAQDHSTISRFRMAMTQSNAYEILFKELRACLKGIRTVIQKFRVLGYF